MSAQLARQQAVKLEIPIADGPSSSSASLLLALQAFEHPIEEETEGRGTGRECSYMFLPVREEAEEQL